MGTTAKDLVIGLDLGGTNSELGLVDRGGHIVGRARVKTRGYGDDPVPYVKACAEALRPVIDAVGGMERVVAMGIGAPNGNRYTGCIEFAPNLPWKGDSIPLARLFREAFGVPVGMTNDANAAALGEMTYGAARGMKNFIMVTLGTGVGSGIVCDGRMVYGSDGLAGELGHVIVEPHDGRLCGCGRRGCLEAYCSASGVRRTAEELLATTDTPSLLRETAKQHPIESKDVGEAAAKGDALSTEILRRTGEMLGLACADFACFNSPEAFIFFGGLTHAGEALMRPMREAYEANVLKCYRGKARMLTSSLSEADAAVVGASAIGWEALATGAAAGD